MTVKELYEWAVKNHVENYDIEIPRTDDGYNYTDDCDPEIAERRLPYHTEKVVIV